MNEKQKVILVVEDEDSLLKVIRCKMVKSGFEVITARSVEEAIKNMQSNKDIDVIWLDHYLLGQKTGLDFIVWCKANAVNYKNIPIFVVSNAASADSIQSYLRLGVEKYFIKTEKKLDDIIKDIDTCLSGSDQNKCV